VKCPHCQAELPDSLQYCGVCGGPLGGESYCSHWVVLLDGEKALVRGISPDDRSSLAAFFNRLGPETRFLRFHYAKPRMSDEEIRSYCECDRESVFALVAEMSRNGSSDIVGVGRYDRLPGTDSAEVAFVVEDEEQGNGIGTHLVRELASVAKERGLETMVAETVAYNAIMLSIFRKCDPALRISAQGGSCRVTYSSSAVSTQGTGPKARVRPTRGQRP
jgi:RimJ/RimL family protein N-acetyltransferase